MGALPIDRARALMGEELDRLRTPLAALMQWFASAGVHGTIVGGVAASLRGKPRLTKDIDAIVIDIDAESLLQTGGAFGFSARAGDAVEFARRTHVLLLTHTPTPIDIDVSIGALPFENEVVERSSWIDVGGGLDILIATSEDLVIMKALARRARDIMDIENIIEANPVLDVDRIRRWVREFSSVLEMPEIHEDLEKLLRSRTR